ncbi:MAG TPA: Hpt domain-containing protein [Candidatus Acidoferrum sp.]|nr:Hpt domain-containing protein [Candidatus Acidoferrum sp.]
MSEQEKPTAAEQPRQVEWDLNELLGRLDGDGEFLRDLLVMFHKDARQNLEKSRQAMAERDFVLLARAAHTLKGMLRNLSMGAAAETAAALEAASRENRMDHSAALLEKLEKELEEILPEVEAQLAEVRP